MNFHFNDGRYTAEETFANTLNKCIHKTITPLLPNYGYYRLAMGREMRRLYTVTLCVYAAVRSQ